MPRRPCAGGAFFLDAVAAGAPNFGAGVYYAGRFRPQATGPCGNFWQHCAGCQRSRQGPPDAAIRKYVPARPTKHHQLTKSEETIMIKVKINGEVQSWDGDT